MAEKRLLVTVEGKDALSPKLNEVKKNIKDFGNSASKIEDINDKFQKITSSTAPLKRQLRDILKLMGQMNLDGLDNTALFSDMAQRAGELRDAMADANQAVNAFADDNLKLQTVAQGLTLVASGASIATGAMGLLGVENEKVEQMILKVQSAMSILNGVQAIATVLNKDSALMLRLKAIALKSNTASTVADTAATTANTVAGGVNSAAVTANNVVRKAWNMTVAIGKALLGDWTGLILVGAAALITYSMCTEDSTEKNEENADSIDRVKEAQDTYNSTVNSSVANILGKMLVLETQYKNLRTEGEKIQWIKNNKTEFNKLGISINGVSDAESVFVRNTPKIITALVARAKAIAAQERIVEDYKQMYADLDDVDQRNGVSGNQIKFDMPVSVGEHITVRTARNLGIWDGDSYAVQTVTQEQYDQLKQRYASMARKDWRQDRENVTAKWNGIITQHTKDMVAAQEEADAAARGLEKIVTPKAPDITPKGGGSGSHSGSGSNNTNKPEEVLNPQSLAYAEKQVSALQEQLKKIDPTDTDATQKLQAELKKWQDIVKAKKIELGIDVSLVAEEGSVEYLENKVKEATETYKKLLYQDVSPATVQAALKAVEDANKALENKKIELGIEVKVSEPSIKKAVENKTFGVGSLEDKRQSYENAKSQIDQIKDDFDKGFINFDTAISQINAINAQLQQLGIKPIEVEFKTNLDALNEQFDAFNGKVGGVLNGFNAVDGVVNSVTTLTQSIKDGANAWEILSGVIGVATSVMTTAQAVMEIINLFHAKSTALQIAEAAATTSSTTALGAKTAAQGVEAGTATAAVVANKALEASYLDLAAAAYFAAHAYIPFAGFGIGAGFVTSMLATMATVKATTTALAAFANGGIVEGSAFHGDTTLVRANKGEMILSKPQQANLFNALKNGGAIGGNSGGKVEFEISGQKLRGVLNNYESKQRKIR